MSINIYYFSGTGNSYFVARDIAKNTGGKLISIASVSDKENITAESGIIGIIFPRYYGYEIGMPLMVRNFILKLENIESKYIFAMCIYGAGFGDIFIIIDKLIKSRGGKLSAGYGVPMPQNAFNKPWVKNMRLFQKWDERKEIICNNIKSKKIKKFDKTGFLLRLLTVVLSPVLKPTVKQSMAKCANLTEDQPFERIIHFADNSFKLDEQCNGCGICLKVCPAGNIKIIANKPLWQHHCENCLACFNWCPNNAIHSTITLNNYHYHHPEVKASDMFILK